MHRLLFAINHRATEEAIANKISDDYLVVDAVTYKEAVLDKLGTTEADTLLIRETLPGSMDLERLFKRIRVEYPNVRIIVICSEHPKQDPFLKMLVDLAIYDIINSDKPRISEICSYILTPRTFRDAVQYGDFTEKPASAASKPVVVENVESENKPKDNGILGKAKGLFKQFMPLAKSNDAVNENNSLNINNETSHVEQINIQSDIPKIDIELLRETVQESEARKAQAGMDLLIEQAVNEKTSFLLNEKAKLEKKVADMEEELKASDSYSVGVIKELSELKEEKDRLNTLVSDLRAEMQKGYTLYEEQLRALQNPENTPTWYQDQSSMWEAQRDSLSTALSDKTKEADELSFKVDVLNRQLQESKAKESALNEKLQIAQDAQLSERGTDDLIKNLRAELSEEKENNIALLKKINDIEEELSIAKQGGPDYSYPLVDIPLLPDDTVYTISSTSPQTLLFIGAKHGVGATTVALNTAASLAGRGYKTLLVEVNANYPMLNQYFEFTHIPFGINEAIKDISEGNISNIDRAIIRPHGLSPTQANLYKTYKKLPAGLHFMLFSNDTLVSHNYENNTALSEATIYTLLNYLIKRQQYSHIILDIQCDDRRMLQAVLNSGCNIDKLAVVTSQDPHALATTGILITTLSRARMASLVANGEFVVNRYNPAASMTVSKIEKMLHIGNTQLSKISEDSTGYLSASMSALPYIINKGRFAVEYDNLRNRLVDS